MTTISFAITAWNESAELERLLNQLSTVINIQDKGTVFVNGTSKDNWGWAGIKVVETTDEEKEKFKGATHKSDPKTLMMFSKEQFDEACHYIGLI